MFAAKGREIHRALPLLVSGHLHGGRTGEGTVRAVLSAGAAFLARAADHHRAGVRKVPLKVTGNTGRLAMRQSRSQVAHALLDWLDQPLISTSANISGQPTCRSGIEVFGT